MGAHHVIYPEAAMGDRVAHLITSRMLDFIEFDDRFALAMTRVPQSAVNRVIRDLGLRKKFGITVVGVKRPGKTPCSPSRTPSSPPTAC